MGLLDKLNLGKNESQEKIKGSVKRFNAIKGFGFITGEDEKEYFFHYSELQMDGFKNIKPNTAVEFVPAQTDKGLQAKEIVKVA